MTDLKYKILAEKLDLKHYFAVEYNVLSLIGFDLNSKQQTLKHPWWTFLTCCCIFTLMIGMGHFSWQHISELDLVTDALGPFVQSMLAMWKCGIFIYKRQELVAVVHRVWELGMEATAPELKLIAKENAPHMRLCLIYSKVVFGSTLACLAIPMVIGSWAYLSHGVFVYQPPLTASYPFDVANPLNFLFIYIWSILGIHFVVTNTIGIDSLYSWCVTNLSAQFKVVQLKIERVTEIDSTLDAKALHKCLIEFIKYHQQVIELVALLNRAFWPIILAEFTINSTQLCFLGFQIGRGLEMSRMPLLIGFMLTVLMQLLLYSYGGQRLEDESVNVASACFENPEWQLWPLSAKKLFLLIILRAQKPCQMTAFFFCVNVKLFVWVLHTACSYIALLRSIGSE